MAEPATAKAQDQDRTSGSPSFPFSGAVLGAVLYVGGFVVVSLYEGQFGITEFGLLRTRVLAAGLLLALFVVLPARCRAPAVSVFRFRKDIREQQSSTCPDKRTFSSY